MFLQLAEATEHCFPSECKKKKAMLINARERTACKAFNAGRTIVGRERGGGRVGLVRTGGSVVIQIRLPQTQMIPPKKPKSHIVLPRS